MQRIHRAAARIVPALAFAAWATHAAAEPAEYVSTPIIEEGERELEAKAGVSRLHDGSSTWQQAIGFGMGLTSYWATEVYAQWHRDPGATAGFDSWEWENRVQLTETGRYPVDVGLILEIERPQERDQGYELRFGPLFQTESGPWQMNLNLLFEKHVRAQPSTDSEFHYQWQVKYAWQPALDFGMQGFGATGPWDNWDARSEQQHVLGPALFGKIKVGPQQALKYNAGLMFGTNDASPRATLRVQAEYEF